MRFYEPSQKKNKSYKQVQSNILKKEKFFFTMETRNHSINMARLQSLNCRTFKNSNKMKKILTIVTLALAINAFAQQTSKTFTGPYSIGINDGTATYTYFEQNGERIIDGNFSFNCPAESITISGKYSKGKKSGLWTRKQTYSRYNGMVVVKSELKWPKVTENIPFKEITEVTTENYVNDKLEGSWSQTKTVKNSWGYPAPGGSSSAVFIVKKNFVADELTSIEATRKKNDKLNTSLKGAYKNKMADGSWSFNDNKYIYSYTFKNGYLTAYEIKEIGTGKIINSQLEVKDIEAQNNFFSDNENSFDVKYVQNFDKDTVDAKIFVQTINDNLKIVKICKLNKTRANFVNLDVTLFTSAFGDFTPYKIGYDEAIALGANIECEVLSEKDYFVYNRFFFTNVKTEKRFLDATCNSKEEFMNTNWQAERINPTVGLYFFQLKNHLYNGDTLSLKSYVDYMAKNFTFQKSNSQIEINENLLFLTAYALKDTIVWRKCIDDNFNKFYNGQKWQSSILVQLDSIVNYTAYSCNKEEALKYISYKDKEIENYNNKVLENIQSISIGDQIWMAEDLKLIPSFVDYRIYPQDTINALSKIYKRFPDFGNSSYSDKIEYKNNNYEIRISSENKNILVPSRKINQNISPEYFNSNDVQKLCPNGWRLPTEKDLDNLNNILGGDKSATDKFLRVGGGSGFESKELRYIFINTKDKKPWIFYGFINGRSDAKDFAKCRCIKE
jgi:uncharacterized protein (TIGR02145 family)